jgi:hypothetical protein
MCRVGVCGAICLLVVLVIDDEGKGQENVCVDVPWAVKGGLERLDRGTEAETTMDDPRQA